jgi:hypothetical protein
MLLVPLALALALSGCGGGGGGGSSGGSSPYTGATTAAVVTQSNADNIATGAYQGGAFGASTVGPLSLSDSAGAGLVRPHLLVIVETLKEAADKVLPRQRGQAAPKEIITDSGTIYGDYGGRLDYTLSVDDQTGDFNGTFTFVNFRSACGGTVSGTIGVSGVYDLNTDTISQIHFSIASLVVTQGTIGNTISGTLDITASGTTTTAVLNLFLRDNATGKVVWANNLTTSITSGSGYEDVTFSGRIYLHDYGYVDAATPTPFHYPAGSIHPTSGVMILTGRNNAKVRLTANATDCTVAWDLDGNGTYEGSVTHNWP